MSRSIKAYTLPILAVSLLQMKRRLLVLLAVLFSDEALAQQQYDRRYEVFVMTGSGHVFRRRGGEDSVSIGAGIGIRLSSRFNVELEYNQLPNLSPKPISCGGIGNLVGGIFVPLPCVGTGRNGPDRFSLASANLLYSFSDSRIQPYVAGGAGVDWSRSFSSISRPQGNEVIITETFSKDSGFVWNMGAGIRIYATPRVSIRPDVRYYNAVLMSSHNLAVVRLGVGLGVHW